jgi:hypothetical protein
MPNPLFHHLAREMLEAHATQEWVAYCCYKKYFRKRPSPHVKHIMEEELEHYRLLEAIYPGALLRAVKAKQPKKIPVIGSELEFFLASWIFDYAGLVQIEGLQKCAWKPYGKVAKKILADEREHKAEGLKRVKRHLRSHPAERARARKLALRWLHFALPAFGQAGSPFDRLAVKLGLKSRTSLAQRTRFEAQVRKQVASF